MEGLDALAGGFRPMQLYSCCQSFIFFSDFDSYAFFSSLSVIPQHSSIMSQPKILYVGYFKGFNPSYSSSNDFIPLHLPYDSSLFSPKAPK